MKKIFSFFSGAGFLDLGFESAGFETVYVNENHKPFLESYIYARRFLDIPTPKYGYNYVGIEGLDCDEIRAQIELEWEKGAKVGFIGGPPCPDFSVGGKNKGKLGKNGILSEVYVDKIVSAEPDFFLFENVKGLWRTKKHREFFEKLKAKLSKKYFLENRLVNSLQYGAPQDRDRIILIGFHKRFKQKIELDWQGVRYPDRTAFDFPWPKQNKFAPKESTKCPAEIPQELTVQFWFERNGVGTHPNSKDRFKPRAGLSKFLIIEEGDVSKKSYKRLHRWRYSPTVAYGNNEVHLHPFEARRISVAEALALQSLPKEFSLPPWLTLSNKFKTIGNGVPFLLALGLAKTIEIGLEYYESESYCNSREFGKNHQATAAE